MNYYIITGTSSGIGEAIARKLILDRQSVICISRTLNETLTDIVSPSTGRLWYFESDLGELNQIPSLMNEIFVLLGRESITSLTLVNNAAVLDPVAAAGEYDLLQLKQHFNVNLLAPVILSNEFIRLSGHQDIPRTIVNIGSGAAGSPYAGWGPYCSSKAGLEMFTRTTNLEQISLANPVRMLSIAPGIVDTPMQQKIRHTSSGNFPMKPKFEQLYQENLLSRPSDVAQKIIGLINGSLSCDSEIIDLRKI